MKYAPRKATGLAPGEVFRPVVGLDIDGTLADYHRHFALFAQEYTGMLMPAGRYDSEEPFWRWLGLSRTKYREVKLHYRMSGLKRAMPLLPYARDAVHDIRGAGAEVVMCTTRPYLKIDGIEEDTLAWLRRNGVPHDGLILGERKYQLLAKRYGVDRVVGIVDDLPELVQQAREAGLRGWLMHREYNQSAWSQGDEFMNMLQAGQQLKVEVKAWRRAQMRSTSTR